MTSVYICVTQLPSKIEYMTTQTLPTPFPVNPFQRQTLFDGFLPGVILPILELSIIGSTHCGLWPHSLHKMFLRFTMFSLLSDIPLHESHSLVICSPVDRFLGCFHFLAIVNKAAMNILYKSFYGHVLPFLLGKYIRMKLLGQKYVSFYKKLPDLFPKWLYYFVFPPITYEDSPSPTFVLSVF